MSNMGTMSYVEGFVSVEGNGKVFYEKCWVWDYETLGQIGYREIQYFCYYQSLL